MITVFVILLFYHGEIIVVDRNLPTYDLCEKRRAVIESRMADVDPVFAGKLRCVQTEIQPSEEGKENAIYHQASATYQ